MNPAALYTAYRAIGHGLKPWDRLDIDERSRWVLVSLAANGWSIERADPALDTLARMALDASHDSITAHYRLRVWAFMAGARPHGLGSLQLHPGEATVAMGAALARLAKIPGFDWMRDTPAGEPPGIALGVAVDYVQKVCAVVAEKMTPHSLTTSEIAGVVATIRRVADGYDSLRGYDLPVATALRCAANLIERSER